MVYLLLFKNRRDRSLCIFNYVINIFSFQGMLADYLDKEIEEQEVQLETVRTEHIEAKEKLIQLCDDHIEAIKLQPTLGDILKDGVKVQLETEYRARVAQAYMQVKKRLDYHVAMQMVQRRISQKHMAQWIINNVLKAITPEQEKATLLQCVKDLQALSARA
ncbi:hypothetical protein KM043_003821 [Ampulex compressa]|nr:hypothetical protein KM043_003821 [Ampulex compressa]